MANSKFIGRVVSLQTDVNTSLTELYKTIIKYSNIPINDQLLSSFEYTLAPPKSLNTVNLIEMMSNADAMAQNLVRTMIGDSANDDSAAQLKDIFYKKVIKEYLPMVEWNRIESLLDESKIELSGKAFDDKSNNEM